MSLLDTACPSFSRMSSRWAIIFTFLLNLPKKPNDWVRASGKKKRATRTFATKLQKPFRNFATEIEKGTECSGVYRTKSIAKLWKKWNFLTNIIMNAIVKILTNIIMSTIMTAHAPQKNMSTRGAVATTIITMKKAVWNPNSFWLELPSSSWLSLFSSKRITTWLPGSCSSSISFLIY